MRQNFSECVLLQNRLKQKRAKDSKISAVKMKRPFTKIAYWGEKKSSETT